MVLVPLLGSPAKEAVLLYVLTHGEAYPTEVAAALRRALVVVQNQLSRLEDGGVVVSRLRGKVRLYQLNPRYPFRKELETLLSGAVRRQLVADVPLGILLSGGLDSSLITAIAAKVADQPLKTFTISFPRHDSFNEGPYARLVAEYFEELL